MITRTSAALLAGTAAILLNTAALKAADFVPLATAHGGLLRLLLAITGLALPAADRAVLQAAFHVGVGLAMALVYAFAIEPVLAGPSWFRGILYAAAVWLANALIVLPALDEGFAGSRYLSLGGMTWFAAAHTMFFVIQAILYERLRKAKLSQIFG